MKIKLHNFGAIYQFEFDTQKSLHFIYGNNNVGKSYVIRATYLILKNVLEQSNYFREYFFQLMETRSSHLRTLTNEIEFAVGQKNYEPLELNSYIQKVVKEALEGIFIPALRQSFQNTFASDLQNKQSTERFEISIQTQNLKISIQERKDKTWFMSRIELFNQYWVAFDENKTDVEQSENQTILYINPKQISIEKLREEVISVALALIQRFFQTFTKKIDEVYFLPASRSGLYQAMNAFSMVFAKLSQLKNLSDTPVIIPSLSEPIADYFLKLSSIKPDNHNDKFTRLAHEIETEIFDAQIVYNAQTHHLECYNRKNGLRLRLSDVSTLIAELAPLVAFLKFVISEQKENRQLNIFSTEPPSENTSTKQKILFIEEPEAHLHSEIQEKILDMMVEMTKIDLKVVVASHSKTMNERLATWLNEDKAVKENTQVYPIKMTAIGSIVDIPTPAIEEFNETFEDNSALLKNKIKESLS